jgi:predicted metal-dependent peptidase
MSDAVATKLSAAATRLILDKPFLGALVLRLPMIEADAQWCRTTATDARSFYYNPDYIDALSLEQTQFVLAHEALHCALSHFARRQHRNKMRWDVACDLAVNPLLLQDGLKPPPGALHLAQFDGMTAEEIYPCLDENDDDETHRPAWDLKKWKDLRDDLNEHPAHDCVRHSDAINFASLQFGEKFPRIHCPSRLHVNRGDNHSSRCATICFCRGSRWLPVGR